MNLIIFKIPKPHTNIPKIILSATLSCAGTGNNSTITIAPTASKANTKHRKTSVKISLVCANFKYLHALQLPLQLPPQKALAATRLRNWLVLDAFLQS